MQTTTRTRPGGPCEEKSAVGRSFLAPLVSCPHGPQGERPTSLASAGAVIS